VIIWIGGCGTNPPERTIAADTLCNALWSKEHHMIWDAATGIALVGRVMSCGLGRDLQRRE
jgi:hypothetical protein